MRTRSPFPGMDPYLQRHWLDVHSRLSTYACDDIQEQISSDLVARLGERLVIDDMRQGLRKSIHPDVYVSGPQRDEEDEPNPYDLSPWRDKLTDTYGGVAVAVPKLVEVNLDDIREPFVEIYDVNDGGRIVTTIEFISPTNKRPGDGWKKYKHKQHALLDSFTNLVEIDLIRGGQRPALLTGVSMDESLVPEMMACVSRGTNRHFIEFYAIGIRDRLPTVRIPLRLHDADAILDLQQLIDRAYKNGAYGRSINYDVPPEPLLREQDVDWAKSLVHEASTAS